MVLQHVVCFLPGWKLPVINKLALLTRSVGMDFFQVNDEQELADFFQKHSSEETTIFSDSSCLECLKQYDSIENARMVILLTSRLQNIADDLQKLKSIHCMIANHDKDFDGRDVLIILKKFQERNILGLSKYLGYGAEIITSSVGSDQEKKQVIQNVHDFVAGLGGPDNNKFLEYGRRTSELVDELILNGVFNANPRFHDKPRSQPFQLEDHERVSVHFGFDGDNFGVSVVDAFGSLTRDKILNYLNDSRSNDDVSSRRSGGLGLKVIFDRLHRFVVNVNPGHTTEAICLLQFENRIRDFDKKLRSFYYFSSHLDEAS